MWQEILKAIIIEGQEILEEISVVPRAFQFEQAARYVFVGIRQAGKSYLLYLRALQLIAEGHDIREMVFVNFDDERLTGFSVTDFDAILQAYAALYPHRPILFLDEIQNIVGWEHFARRMANLKYTIYITGSNAKMLSRDIATTLGGRFLEQRVFTYSFREFLAANSIEVSADTLYSKTRGEVERMLTQYFNWGGFPELSLYVNKRKWLNELYEKIILGDILQRNRIRNEQALRLTLQRLAENIKTPTSFNRLANLVRSTGLSTTAASVTEYIGYCKDACLIFDLENYASKFVERATVRKHYFTDNGLLNIFLTDSETSLLENLVALTLYRQTFESDDFGQVYFYNKECELDFYIPSQKKGIQSSFSIRDPRTREREINALTTFHRLYGLNEAEIVTYSEEEVIEADGLTIRVIPLYRWLLSFR